MNHNRILIVLLSMALALVGILFVVLLTSIPVSQAAPAQPSSIDPSEYFPLQVRSQWVYSWTNNIYAPTPISETIVITEQVASFYTFHAFHNQADGRFSLSNSSGYQWSGYATSGSNPFPLPLYMLLKYLYIPTNLFPSSFHLGDVWSGTGKYGGTVYTGTTTAVTNMATVVANGRTFNDCLHIRTVITGPNQFGAGTRNAWFAPGIGLVKLNYNHDDGSVTQAELQMWSQVHNVFLPLVVRNFEMVQRFLR